MNLQQKVGDCHFNIYLRHCFIGRACRARHFNYVAVFGAHGTPYVIL